MFYGLLGVIAVIAVVVFSYLQHPKFGDVGAPDTYQWRLRLWDTLL